MKYYLLFILLISNQFFWGQNRFILLDSSKVNTVPFELVNDLIIVKANINGSVLKLIFDTGVKQTILINMKANDSIHFENITKRNFSGVGIEKSVIEAFESKNNKLSLYGQVYNTNATLFIITSHKFRLSEHIGIVVNGFIGGDLIKDFIVKIDYKNNVLQFYKHDLFYRKKLRKFTKIPIVLIKGKPYIEAQIQHSRKQKPQKLKLLIDTGNADALWVFNSKKDIIPKSKKQIIDFLGSGFSGDVEGKRLKTDVLRINKFKLRNIFTALPDSVYFENIVRKNHFDGIIGNEILKKFYIILDYKNKSILLKKYRHNFHEHFYFNNSGIYLAYDGKILNTVKSVKTNYLLKPSSNREFYFAEEAIDYVYETKLMNKIVISYIRKGSPGDKSGLIKGDAILKINGENVYDYHLNEISKNFFYQNSKKVHFEILRNGSIFHFVLLNEAVLN